MGQRIRPRLGPHVLLSGATFLLAVACLHLACVGTSVPQPPNFQPLDPDRISTNKQERTSPSLEGEAGAAAPGSDLWLWNLEGTSAPTVAVVEDDGSFSALVPSDFPLDGTGEVRIQARSDGLRSAPLDFTLTGGIAAPSIRPDCLRLPQEVVLGAARRATFKVENRCETALRIEMPFLRVGEPELTVTVASGSLELEVGSDLTLEVSASGITTVEDIVFLRTEIDGMTVRYPVSLIANPSG